MNILIIGTNFTSSNSLKTQGQFLYEALKPHFHKVGITSSHRNYALRIVDTINHIFALNKNDIAILQVYSSKSIYLEFISAFLIQLKGVRLISTLHGGNIPAVYKRSSLKRWMLNQIFKFSDTVTAPSHYIPSQIPAISNRYILVRNIIDLTAYQQKKLTTAGKIKILWMRAYHPVYDPMKAIKVFEAIWQQNNDAEMVMAGSDFGLKKELEQYISTKPYVSKITLLDVIDNHKKNELASTASVYLSTNKIDNAPVSFLEMMAMGLPIVTTNIGGIPYYVTNHETALLSDDNSHQDLAYLILQLHNQPLLQEKLIQNGLQFIKEFSVDTVIKQWLSILKQTPSC